MFIHSATNRSHLAALIFRPSARLTGRPQRNPTGLQHTVSAAPLSKAALVTAVIVTRRDNVQFQPTDKRLTSSAQRSSHGPTDQRLLRSAVTLVRHRIRHSRPTSGYLTFIHRVAERPTGDHQNRQCQNLMESR